MKGPILIQSWLVLSLVIFDFRLWDAEYTVLTLLFSYLMPKPSMNSLIMICVIDIICFFIEFDGINHLILYYPRMLSMNHVRRCVTQLRVHGDYQCRNYSKQECSRRKTCFHGNRHLSLLRPTFKEKINNALLPDVSNCELTCFNLDGRNE